MHSAFLRCNENTNFARICLTFNGNIIYIQRTIYYSACIQRRPSYHTLVGRHKYAMFNNTLLSDQTYFHEKRCVSILKLVIICDTLERVKSGRLNKFQE